MNKAPLVLKGAPEQLVQEYDKTISGPLSANIEKNFSDSSYDPNNINHAQLSKIIDGVKITIKSETRGTTRGSSERHYRAFSLKVVNITLEKDGAGMCIIAEFGDQGRTQGVSKILMNGNNTIFERNMGYRQENKFELSSVRKISPEQIARICDLLERFHNNQVDSEEIVRARNSVAVQLKRILSE